MHRVHGRVVVQETGEGVRDLTIVVLDVEREALPRLRPGGLVGQPVSALTVPGVRRLGSVVTDGAGRFSLEAVAKDGLRTLVLLATAPETAGKGGCPRVVHVSCDAADRSGSARGVPGHDPGDGPARQRRVPSRPPRPGARRRCRGREGPPCVARAGAAGCAHLGRVPPAPRPRSDHRSTGGHRTVSASPVASSSPEPARASWSSTPGTGSSPTARSVRS